MMFMIIIMIMMMMMTIPNYSAEDVARWIKTRHGLSRRLSRKSGRSSDQSRELNVFLDFRFGTS